MFWKVGYFVRDFWKAKGPFEKVLDVGSRNINGSVKDFIEGYKEFTGVDMIKGKDVDVVLNAHYLMQKFQPETFDLITCCETLEHDDRFWITVFNMRQLLKPGGWLVVTTPGINFFKHDFPHDYYRFTEEAHKHFIQHGFEQVRVENYSDQNSEFENKPNTILSYGRKPKQ